MIYFHVLIALYTIKIPESMVAVEAVILSLFTVCYKSEGTGSKCYAFDCKSFEMNA
jgi:hypothetical protein